MSIEDLNQRGRNEPVLPVLPLPAYENDTTAWSSGDFFRLLVAPALVTLFIVGGVFWIRLQMVAGTTAQQRPSVMQVQLLPRPEAVPVVATSVTEFTMQTVRSNTEIPPKEPDATTSDDAAPVPRARTVSPAEAPPSNVLSSPSAMSGPASSVAVKFQQALLDHVARYQRYPNAARSQQLQGKVDTRFAMGRDGQLLGVWVRSSSGQIVLDKEAVETIRRAQPLPPIPPELPDRLNIDLQLLFDPS